MPPSTYRHASSAMAEPTMTAREINTLELGIPFSIASAPAQRSDQDSNIRVQLAEDSPEVTVPSGASDEREHDILINGEPPSESAWDWKPLLGLSNQYQYHGAIFHPSEFIGANLAYRLCSMAAKTPALSGTRIFVVTEVKDEADPEALVGWCILYKMRPR